MKVIGSADGVRALSKSLADFIFSSCPWIDSEWDPTRIGWLFVLGDDDVEAARSLCVVPLVSGQDSLAYRASMTFDLNNFTLWEEPVIQDKVTGYWSAVAIVGQEFGFAVILSPVLVNSMGLRSTLEPLLTGSFV